jgi:drug/metabolite transporter (DMT)-like permease
MIAMSLLPRSAVLRGLLLSALGMVVISPDGVLLHMISSAPLLDMVFWRTFGSGLTLLLGLTVVYRRRLPQMIAHIGGVGIVCTILMSIANLLFVDGMAHTSVANTLVFMASMPLWSALLGLVILREAVKGTTWFAIILGFLGIGVIMSDSVSLGGASLRGDLSALGAAVAYGLNLVFLRRAGDRDMTACLMLSGFLTAAICLPFLETAAVAPTDWWILGALGLVILPLALTLFMAGARTAPAAEVALLSLIETVLGPLWAWLALGETPSQHALIGGGLILLAVSLPAVRTIVRRRRTAIAANGAGP